MLLNIVNGILLGKMFESIFPFSNINLDIMPFCFDFNLAHGDVHTVELSPDGWKSPIFVEYIVAQAHRYDTMRSIVWRVKGTTHSFTIEEQRLNHLTHGNYKAHFKKVLERFRIDYLNWFKDEQYKDCQWKYEYQQQFDRFIIPDQNNGGENKQN